MAKFTNAELLAIEQADAQRRLEREVAELQAIATRTVDPYHWSRGISGEPSQKNRQYRASKDCWSLGLSNPRLAYTRTLLTETMLPNTVKYTDADGNVRVVPTSHFHKTRVHTKQRETVKREAPQRRSDIALMAQMGTIHTEQ